MKHALQVYKQLWNSVLTNWKSLEILYLQSQTNEEWKAQDPKLIPYQRYIKQLILKFKSTTFTNTPRAHNHFANALTTLASLIKLSKRDDVQPLQIETQDIISTITKAIETGTTLSHMKCPYPTIMSIEHISYNSYTNPRKQNPKHLNNIIDFFFFFFFFFTENRYIP